jgi:hypothetical protein
MSVANCFGAGILHFRLVSNMLHISPYSEQKITNWKLKIFRPQMKRQEGTYTDVTPGRIFEIIPF